MSGPVLKQSQAKLSPLKEPHVAQEPQVVDPWANKNHSVKCRVFVCILEVKPSSLYVSSMSLCHSLATW